MQFLQLSGIVGVHSVFFSITSADAECSVSLLHCAAPGICSGVCCRCLFCCRYSLLVPLVVFVLSVLTFLKNTLNSMYEYL